MQQTSDPDIRRSAWKAIGVFLLILLAQSAVFESLMAQQGRMTRILVTGVMWSPGVAALLTCLYLRRPVASLPWQWGAWRWNIYAWALPLIYGLFIYVPVWLFGLGGGGFGNPETLGEWSQQITGSEQPGLAPVAFYILLMGTVGMALSASRALGEELGWRGFLIWEMRKVMPFWVVGLLSGLIWGLWHWPAILLADYNAGEGNFLAQMFLFTMGIAPQGIVYAYFTFRSNSLWPAVILHSSHNLFIQAIYTPLTIKGEGSHLYIDEFGFLLPVVSCTLAILFYLRARREGLA